VVNGTTSLIKFKNILYVPELGINFISISQFTDKKVAIIHIRNEYKMISEYGTSRLFMTGVKEENLWRLHITSYLHSSSANFVSTEPSTPCRKNVMLHRWHERLGHINFPMLKQMAQEETISSLNISPTTQNDVSSGCTYGKHHRSSFPITNGERKRTCQKARRILPYKYIRTNAYQLYWWP